MYATLPLAAQQLAVMSTIVPASMLMARIGRRAGFTIGACFGIAGTSVATLGVLWSSFPLFCLGMALNGSYIGFSIFFRFAALEGAGKGVTSNCINPGYVRTPLVEKQIAEQAAVHGLPEDEVLAKIMLTSSPVKRLIEPAEVAAAAAFLCSSTSNSMTGSQIVLDGGWGAR